MLPVPWGVQVERVETTAELLAAVRRHLPDADLLLMAAAPADYRPAQATEGKRPRGEGAMTLALEPTDDVLEGTRDQRKPGARVVGFAFETSEGVARARAKLERKSLDLVVLNLAEPGAGTEVDTNRITILSATGEEPGPLESKLAAACRILDAVERLG
jgi:phosphopantothenoylcysteine decarboxylase/phosphopantothenate--cysteine ligase